MENAIINPIHKSHWISIFHSLFNSLSGKLPDIKNAPGTEWAKRRWTTGATCAGSRKDSKNEFNFFQLFLFEAINNGELWGFYGDLPSFQWNWLWFFMRFFMMISMGFTRPKSSKIRPWILNSHWKPWWLGVASILRNPNYEYSHSIIQIPLYKSQWIPLIPILFPLCNSH